MSRARSITSHLISVRETPFDDRKHESDRRAPVRTGRQSRKCPGRRRYFGSREFANESLHQALRSALCSRRALAQAKHWGAGKLLGLSTSHMAGARTFVVADVDPVLAAPTVSVDPEARVRRTACLAAMVLAIRCVV